MMAKRPRGQVTHPIIPQPQPPRTGTWYEVYVNWPEGPGCAGEFKTLAEAEDEAEATKKRGFGIGKAPRRTEEVVILEVCVRQIKRTP
jgi:hypothetical protein